jgi:hypothetical protein
MIHMRAKHRKRQPNRGQTKDRAAYMRQWRQERLEEARWQWALNNVREQVAK